jgi:hypothetical protein
MGKKPEMNPKNGVDDLIGIPGLHRNQGKKCMFRLYFAIIDAISRTSDGN